MAQFTKRVLAVFLLAFFISPPSLAERIEATYNFIWNGFVVFTTDVAVERSSREYGVNMNVRTRGVMRLFSRGEGDLQASGVVGEDGAIIARHFSSKGRWDGDNYRKEIFFDEAGRFVRWERDWPEEWLEDYERKPVPDDMKLGPDGLSVIMKLLAQKPPESTLVFDGDQVMEIRLDCGEPEQLKKSRHSAAAGAATKCQLATETIAGEVIETEEQQQKRLKKEEKTRKRAERYARKSRGDDEDTELDEVGFPIWFQEIEGVGYALPVRASFKSSWGTIRMYLKELKTSDGVHLKP